MKKGGLCQAPARWEVSRKEGVGQSGAGPAKGRACAR